MGEPGIVAVGLLVALLQFGAVALAVRLYVFGGRAVAWLILAGALALLALHHLTALFGPSGSGASMGRELVWLMSSALLLAALALLLPFFQVMLRSLMEYRQAADHYGALRRLSRLASSGLDLPSLMQRAVEVLGGEFGDAGIMVLEYVRDPNRFVVRGSNREAWPAGAEYPFEPAGPEVTVLAGRGPLRPAPETAQASREAGAGKESEDTVILRIPGPGRAYGVLLLELGAAAPAATAGRQALRRFAGAVADLLGATAGNREAERVLRQACGALQHRLETEETRRQEVLAQVAAEAERRAALESELERLRENLERALAARATLLGGVNKAFRIPLNSVLGFAQVLRQDTVEPLSDIQQQSVNEILRAAGQLRSRVDAWIDLARIETMHVPAGEATVLVEDAVRRALRGCEGLLEGRRIRALVPGELCRRHTARLDTEMLRQVVQNLVTALVMYAVPGGELQVSCTAGDSGAGLELGLAGTLEPEGRDSLLAALAPEPAEPALLEPAELRLLAARRALERAGGELRGSAGAGGMLRLILRLPAAAAAPGQARLAEG